MWHRLDATNSVEFSLSTASCDHLHELAACLGQATTDSFREMLREYSEAIAITHATTIAEGKRRSLARAPRSDTPAIPS